MVPGDLSSALFLIVAAALVPGSELVIRGVGLNPTRSGALEVLRKMGADLTFEADEDRAGEPTGTVVVRASELHSVSIGGAEVPTMIDEIPILAVAATQAEGETVISEAGELRVKESDRLTALATELTKLGADIEEQRDGLIVRGPTTLHGGEVESYGDHRIALALAIAGTIAGANVRVSNWSCIDTSFPEFLDILGSARR
jgi:3-phosphoshikimate 1-carboxyvinyltransferase